MSFLKKLFENFLQRFPEFEDTEPKLIEMALAEAQGEMSQKHWGQLYSTAACYLAAHKLAISPMGEPARLQGDEKKTTYQLEYERLYRHANLGVQVA